jgi:hypothetical protein
MELEALKKSWEEYDKKLDQNLKLNKQIFKEMNLTKTRLSLRSILIFRILEILFFVIAVIALGSFIGNHWGSMQFVIPAAILHIFAIIGLAGSIGQIALIAQIDYAAPITIMQKKLEQVKMHMVQVTRLMMLSIPFYLAYAVLGFKLFFGVDIVAQGDPNWWLANIILSLLFIPLAIWIYQKLSWKNMHIPWVKSFIYSAGGKQITKAMGFLQEIDNFEKETTIL